MVIKKKVSKKLVFFSTVGILLVSLFVLVRLTSITAADISESLASIRKKIRQTFERTKIQSDKTIEELKAKQDLEQLLKKLQVKTTDEAVIKIDQLSQECPAVKEVIELVTPPASQAQLQQLLQELQAVSVEEALKKIQSFNAFLKDLGVVSTEEAMNQIFKKTTTVLASIYQTIANALNAKKLQTQLLTKDPESLLNEKQLKELNQTIYDQIIELKKRYFEATQIIESYANPLISSLNDIIKAKQQGASCDDIMNLIPDSIPAKPSLEGMSREDLLKAINELSVED